MRTILEQSQKQVLSQNLIQSVEILQMSAEELTEHIREMVLENPAADLEEPSPEGLRQDLIRKLERLESLDEQNRTYYQYDREDSDRSYIENIGKPVRETLKDSLLQQLISGPYSEQQRRIFSYIADCLDSDGFFRMSAKEAAGGIGVPERVFLDCLKIMQGLEPAGVCCTDLTDCLLEQLRREGQPYDVEKTILTEYLELLGKNQLHVIAKKMKLPIDRIKTAQLRIRSLNPRPAQGFDTGETPRYIVPDVTIVRYGDRFEVLINNSSYPTVRVNRNYLKMLKENPSREVCDYLTDKVNQIKQLHEHIERRESTLLALSDCILQKQMDFFLYGDTHLKPFRMKDAAAMLDIHESTVSRAVKDKYLQCCWGIYPFSYFFARSVGAEGDDCIATHQIKEEIRRIIDAEDKTRPLNDDKIAAVLKERGMPISRRTVVKYRESMDIPNYRGRKEY